MPPDRDFPPNQDESGTISIVYDGECPACSYLFNDLLVIRLRKERVNLIDARENRAYASALEAQYDISLDREFGARVEGKWYFGSEAIYAVFLSARINNKWLRPTALICLRILYPLLRMGRRLLLLRKGVSPLNLAPERDNLQKKSSLNAMRANEALRELIGRDIEP